MVKKFLKVAKITTEGCVAVAGTALAYTFHSLDDPQKLLKLINFLDRPVYHTIDEAKELMHFRAPVFAAVGSVAVLAWILFSQDLIKDVNKSATDDKKA